MSAGFQDDFLLKTLSPSRGQGADIRFLTSTERKIFNTFSPTIERSFVGSPGPGVAGSTGACLVHVEQMRIQAALYGWSVLKRISVFIERPANKRVVFS